MKKLIKKYFIFAGDLGFNNPRPVETSDVILGILMFWFVIPVLLLRLIFVKPFKSLVKWLNSHD